MDYLTTCNDVIDCRLAFSRKRNPIARKEHICCECGKKIRKGERYQSFSGLWEDDCGKRLKTIKTCLECVKMWDTVIDAFDEWGEEPTTIVFGMLKEAIETGIEVECLQEDDPSIKAWLEKAKQRSAG